MKKKFDYVALSLRQSKTASVKKPIGYTVKHCGVEVYGPTTYNLCKWYSTYYGLKNSTIVPVFN